MLKQLLLILLAIAPLSNLMAQSANDRAKAYYIQAELDYDDGDYSDAINNLNKVEEILGSTNARVVGLKVKAYYGKGDYSNAQKSLDQFSKYSAKASDGLRNEILTYIVKIDEQLKKEKKALIQIQYDDLFHKSLYHKCSKSLGPEEKSHDVVLVRLSKEGDYRIIIGYSLTKANTSWTFLSTKNPVEDEKYFYLSEDGLISTQYFIDDRCINLANSSLLLVRKGEYGKFGYINKEGSLIISCKYDMAYPFVNGLALIEYNDKMYLIDKKGQIVHSNFKGYPVQSNIVDECAVVSGDTVVVEDNKYVNRKRYGIYDLRNNHFSGLHYSRVELLNEGAAWVWIYGEGYYLVNRKGLKQAGPYLDNNHLEQCRTRCNRENRFSKSFTAIEHVNHCERKCTYSVIDNQGKEIIPTKSYPYKNTYVKIFNDEFIRISFGKHDENHMTEFYNVQGQLVFNQGYRQVYPIQNDMFIVQDLNMVFSIINLDEVRITSQDYDFISTKIYENRRVVKKGEKFGFIDYQGNKITDCKYDRMNQYKDGLASVEMGGKWGIIDLDGNQVVPFSYDYISYFFDGIATAKLDGEKIIIDINGNRVND